MLGENDVVVLASCGNLVGGEVGDRVQRLAPVLLGAGLGRLRRLHVGREGLGPGQQLSLLRTLRLRDLLAELLLLRAQLLEVDDGSAAGGICIQGTVDDGLRQAALHLGGADQVGLVAEQVWVDHAPRLTAAWSVQRLNTAQDSWGGRTSGNPEATGATAVLGLPYAVHSLPSLGR